jgi:hypothetical protein
MEYAEKGDLKSIIKDKIIKFAQIEKNELSREKYLNKYSYSSAANELRGLFNKLLSKSFRIKNYPIFKLIDFYSYNTNESNKKITQDIGRDVVLFWKQNDTLVYGRRHDMVIKYLADRKDIRKVIVFDSPISEFELYKKLDSSNSITQDKVIYVSTYEKILGKFDTHKLSYNIFVQKPGHYRSREDDETKPKVIDDYLPFIDNVLKREGVIPSKSIFWFYPKNFHANEIIEKFKPSKLVVDVVDDHRTWPNIRPEEVSRLDKNYKDLLTKSNLSLANCTPVQESMRKYDKNIVLIPNGCDIYENKDLLSQFNQSKYSNILDGNKKNIGFVGNLESKIDIELLGKVANYFVNCNLVLIGSTHANPEVLLLRKFTNVIFTGVIPYKEVQILVSNFDVGIIPHIKNELTNTMNPLKAFVYLSLNVPVVSTEVSNLAVDPNLIKVSNSHESFVQNIENIIFGKKIPFYLFDSFKLNNSWGARFESIVDGLLKK